MHEHNNAHITFMIRFGGLKTDAEALGSRAQNIVIHFDNFIV